MVPQPPSELVDLNVPELLYLWYVSEGVRDVLGSQQWLKKIRTGKYPAFCMFDHDFCTHFTSMEKLNRHWLKNPTHKCDISGLLQRGRKLAEQDATGHAFPKGQSRSPLKRSESNNHKPRTFSEPCETLTTSELAMLNTCLCRHCGALFDSHEKLREHRDLAQKQGGSCPKLATRNSNPAVRTCK
eukprot:TCALIF_04741-PA protein Name:"Protein of unknown function" AED:0.45 eAED:0.45 QI:0/-1/0/1/-1/1/1/0/184